MEHNTRIYIEYEIATVCARRKGFDTAKIQIRHVSLESKLNTVRGVAISTRKIQIICLGIRIAGHGPE